MWFLVVGVLGCFLVGFDGGGGFRDGFPGCCFGGGGVVDTKSAGRRAVAEGGAYLNNVKVADPDQRLTDDDFLCGRVALVRRGKKTVGALTR